MPKKVDEDDDLELSDLVEELEESDVEPEEEEDIKGGDAPEEEEEGEKDENWSLEIEEEEDQRQVQMTRYLKVVPLKDTCSTERLSMYEVARILGDRARHLDNGAVPYIDVTGYTRSIEIAYDELVAGKIPFSMVRSVGDSDEVEILKVKNATLPELPPLEWFMGG